MAGKITKNMKLGDVVQKNPEAAIVMMQHGLHCIGCHVAAFETIEEGARAHGMSDKDIAGMIRKMNETIAEKKSAAKKPKKKSK